MSDNPPTTDDYLIDIYNEMPSSKQLDKVIELLESIKKTNEKILEKLPEGHLIT